MTHFILSLLAAASILFFEAKPTISDNAIDFKAPTGTEVKSGSEIHFSFVMRQEGGDAPTIWRWEYFDGSRWVCPKKTFSTICTDSGHFCVFTDCFKLTAAVADTLRARAVVVDGTRYNGKIIIGDVRRGVPLFEAYRRIRVQDTRDVAIWGNSFTYYFYSWRMLSQIARSQGHRLKVHASLRGGLTLGQHMERTPSKELLDAWNYEYVLLQDQSMQHAYYTSDSLKRDEIASNTKNAVEAFRKRSPNARVILESTWAYPTKKQDWMGYGSGEAMLDAIKKGGIILSGYADCELSPIADAVASAAAEGIPDLYTEDSKHNNLNLSYLKACVNYLVMYGGDFDKNVPNCGVEPSIALRLREIAKKTVAGK